jgi:hypothetical protein
MDGDVDDVWSPQLHYATSDVSLGDSVNVRGRACWNYIRPRNVLGILHPSITDTTPRALTGDSSPKPPDLSLTCYLFSGVL